MRMIEQEKILLEDPERLGDPGDPTQGIAGVDGGVGVPSVMATCLP
jgi:hypothetical protein